MEKKISKICEGCKKEFFPKPYESGRGFWRFIHYRRFCSQTCKSRYLPSRRKPESFSEAEKERLRKMNKLYGFKRGHSVWNKGRRCPECGRKGIKPWNFKGITPILLNIRNSYQYRLWRSDIFSRDNFTCQICNIRGGKLHAHHLEPFSSVIARNKITNLEEALECSELWNIENGQTLCIPCHKKTDTYSGRAKRKVGNSPKE